MLWTVDLWSLLRRLLALPAFARTLTIVVDAAALASLELQIRCTTVCEYDCNSIIVGHFFKFTDFHGSIQAIF